MNPDQSLQQQLIDQFDFVLQQKSDFDKYNTCQSITQLINSQGLESLNILLNIIQDSEIKSQVRMFAIKFLEDILFQSIENQEENDDDDDEKSNKNADKDSASQKDKKAKKIKQIKWSEDFAEEKLKIFVKDHYKQLFELLGQIIDRNFRNILCRLIGFFCKSLIQEQDQELHEQTCNEIMNLFSSESNYQVDNGFYILIELIFHSEEFFEEYRSKLLLLIEKYIKSTSPMLQTCAHSLILNIMILEEDDTHADTVKFVPQMVTNICQIVQAAGQHNESSEYEEICLENIDLIMQMHEYDIRVFKKYYLTGFLPSIIQVAKDDSIKSIMIKKDYLRIIIEALLIYQIPLQRNQEKLKDIMKAIIYNMNYQQEVSESFKCPKEGYIDNQKNEDQIKYIAEYLNLMDQMMEVLEIYQCLPYINDVIVPMFKNNNDWKSAAIGMMAYSQMGEYIVNSYDLFEDSLKESITAIIGHLNHDNCLTRFAACHCLGQLAEDISIEFSENFASQAIPELIKKLDDQVPRVVSHAAAALTNIVEEMEQNQVSQYIEVIITKTNSLMQNSCSIVKENIVTLIACLSEASKSNFEPHFQKELELVRGILQNYLTEDYKQLRGVSIECLTLMISYVGNQISELYVNQIIDVMLQQQVQQFQYQDPQISYCLSGWQRIIIKHPKAVGNRVQEIAPYIIELIQKAIQYKKVRQEMNNFQNILNNDKKKEKESVAPQQSDDEDSDKKVDQEDIIDIEEACKLILDFLEDIKDYIGLYVSQFSKIIFEILQLQNNAQSEINLIKSMPCLVQIYVKNSNPDTMIESRKICNYLFDKIYDNIMYDELIISYFYSFADCITNFQNLFNQTEVQKYVDAFIKQEQMGFNNYCQIQAKKEEKQTKKKQKKNVNDEENEDDEQMTQEEINIEIKDLEQFLEANFVVVEAFFKSHHNYCLEIVKFFYNQTAQKYFIKKDARKLIQIGLFYLCSVVEQFSYEHISPIIGDIVKTITPYVNSKHMSIIQASSYLIGVIAKKVPKDKFLTWNEQIFTSYSTAMSKLNKEDIKKKDDKHAYDNLISSLGKIIFYQQLGIYEPFYSTWILNLPLKSDLEENKEQIQIITNLPQNMHDFLLIKNFKYAKSYLTVVSNYERENQLSLAQKEIIAESLKKIVDQDENIKQNFATIYKNLHLDEKKYLKQINNQLFLSFEQ